MYVMQQNRCVLVNHIKCFKCSKCPPLTWTHAQRRLCHLSIASSMKLCPKPCQTFFRRCFSSSTSWTWSVSQMFLCMHPCQRKAFSMWLKGTQTIKLIWLILSTIRQNSDMKEFRYFWYYVFSQGSECSVVICCRCGGKYDMSLYLWIQQWKKIENWRTFIKVMNEYHVTHGIYVILK